MGTAVLITLVAAMAMLVAVYPLLQRRAAERRRVREAERRERHIADAHAWYETHGESWSESLHASRRETRLGD
jgi:hypothetical protein